MVKTKPSIDDQIFAWCPNPAHGMFDYHEIRGKGYYRCVTCGHTWRAKKESIRYKVKNESNGH